MDSYIEALFPKETPRIDKATADLSAAIGHNLQRQYVTACLRRYFMYPTRKISKESLEAISKASEILYKTPQLSMTVDQLRQKIKEIHGAVPPNFHHVVYALHVRNLSTAIDHSGRELMPSLDVINTSNYKADYLEYEQLGYEIIEDAIEIHEKELRLQYSRLGLEGEPVAYSKRPKHEDLLKLTPDIEKFPGSTYSSAVIRAWYGYVAPFRQRSVKTIPAPIQKREAQGKAEEELLGLVKQQNGGVEDFLRWGLVAGHRWKETWIRKTLNLLDGVHNHRGVFYYKDRPAPWKVDLHRKNTQVRKIMDATYKAAINGIVSAKMVMAAMGKPFETKWVSLIADKPDLAIPLDDEEDVDEDEVMDMLESDEFQRRYPDLFHSRRCKFYRLATDNPYATISLKDLKSKLLAFFEASAARHPATKVFAPSMLGRKFPSHRLKTALKHFCTENTIEKVKGGYAWRGGPHRGAITSTRSALPITLPAPLLAARQDSGHAGGTTQDHHAMDDDSPPGSTLPVSRLESSRNGHSMPLSFPAASRQASAVADARPAPLNPATSSAASSTARFDPVSGLSLDAAAQALAGHPQIWSVCRLMHAHGSTDYGPGHVMQWLQACGLDRGALADPAQVQALLQDHLQRLFCTSRIQLPDMFDFLGPASLDKTGAELWAPHAAATHARDALRLLGQSGQREAVLCLATGPLHVRAWRDRTSGQWRCMAPLGTGENDALREQPLQQVLEDLYREMAARGAMLPAILRLDPEFRQRCNAFTAIFPADR